MTPESLDLFPGRSRGIAICLRRCAVRLRRTYHSGAHSFGRKPSFFAIPTLLNHLDAGATGAASLVVPPTI